MMRKTTANSIIAMMVLLCLFCASAFAQTRISGKVTSLEDGEPLPGVNVLEKGTTNGGITDVEGNYDVRVSENATLVFSSIGYLREEVAVGTQRVIDMTLAPDISQLQEIIVVGYGTQKKSDITGSVASVPESRLTQLPNTNIAQAIQGAIPGVSVTTNNAGAEQNDNAIVIRGRNSITASNGPLLILDGIPYTGSISDINPVDVASIEVLKDASSSAIYGSRGANGVILITTKKGKEGKVSIAYDGFYGIQTIANKPDLLTGPEFYAFKNTREPGTITGSEEEVFQSGEWVDWYDLATRQGSRTQHTLSVSGGSEKTNFYIAGTYLDVRGLAIGDDYRRYSARINVTTDITPWLSLGTNTQLSTSDNSGLDADFAGEFVGAFYFNPLTTPYNEDGSLTLRPWPEEVEMANPLSPTLATNDDKSYKVFTNNYLAVKLPFLPGLSYRLNTGVEYENVRRGTYYGRNTLRGFTNRGDAETYNAVEKNFTVENIASYDREFGKHTVGATALYSFQSEIFDRNTLEGTGFPNDVLTYYQMDVAALLSPSATYRESNLISQMLRLNYSYDDRYLLTITGRRDGYSGFGQNEKYGFFPSVALGWNITNEPFMNDAGLLSLLKLRASYGLNGNQAVDSYQTLATLRERSYVNGNQTAPGYIPSRLANPILGWESTRSLNIGLDFGLLSDRIQGSLDIYDSKTEDLLLERSISSVQGFSEITQNIGKTSNRGLEVGITSYNIRSDNFSWSTQANLSFNQNKILELYGDGSDDLANEWFIGEPIRVNYGLLYDGVYQLEDDIENSAQPDAQPGYAKIKDVNSDTTINDQDRVIIGQRDPKVIWGMTNNLQYRGFTLTVFIHGVQGVTRENPILTDDVYAEVRRNTIKKNWWTPESPTNEYYANDVDANVRGVNFYENASFMRIKDVSLAYNLSSTLLQKIGLATAKVYVSGRNLATITPYGGLDPEISDQRDIPLQREFLVGVTIGL